MSEPKWCDVSVKTMRDILNVFETNPEYSHLMDLPIQVLIHDEREEEDCVDGTWCEPQVRLDPLHGLIVLEVVLK